MNFSARTLLAACVVGLSMGPVASNFPAQAQKAQSKPLELTWEELMPEGEEERILQLYEAYYATVGAKGGAADVAEGSAADSRDRFCFRFCICLYLHRRARGSAERARRPGARWKRRRRR